MKTNILTISLVAGALAGGSTLTSAQQPAGQPNPVISSPENTGTPSTSGSQGSPGNRFTTTVENLLGRFLGQNQSQVNFDQLPQAVQNTVRAQAGTAPIQGIVQTNTNGQTAYLVNFNRNGQNVNLQVDPAGRILGPVPSGTISQPRFPMAAAAPVSFNQLPRAVQSTLLRYGQGAPIQSVQKGTLQGQTVYEAAFPHNGQNVVLRVDQNGGLLRDAPTDQYLASIGMLPGFGPTPMLQSPAFGSVPDWRTAPARQPLLQANPIAFRSLPQPVRDTLMSFAGDGAIGNVQQGMVGGQIVYEAEVQPNGQPIQLRVSDTGVLLNDQVNDRFLSESQGAQNRNAAMGRAPAWQSGGGSSTSLAPLSNTAPIMFDQLPLAVQTTMRGQANGAPLDRVTQGTLDGRTVYDVTYNKDGQWVTLRVVDDGSVLSPSIGTR